jgi:hypothetical protein
MLFGLRSRVDVPGRAARARAGPRVVPALIQASRGPTGHYWRLAENQTTSALPLEMGWDDDRIAPVTG